MKERVFRYRTIERSIVRSREGARVLDVGCGQGANLVRLRRYGARPWGVDPALERLRVAQGLAPVCSARGEALPWRDESVDLVYVSQVLHHAASVEAVLCECWRIVRPGGLLFVIETVDDSPLMRLARWLRPRWQGDAVLSRFCYRELTSRIEEIGFRVHQGATFNWMYFAWELVPLRFPRFGWASPLFTSVEAVFSPLLDRWGGHCWLVAEKSGPSLFPNASRTRA